MSFHHFIVGPVCMLGVTMLAGCGDQRGENQQAKRDSTASKSAATSKAHPHEHDCDHVGPHGGQVFDLGGAYHAEVVHDEKAGLISIILLDGEARDPVAIEEQQILINAMFKGKPVTFKLAAAPLPSDRDGRSSRFQLKDDALVHSLEDHDSKSRLRVGIDGKQYVADIAACEEHNHEDQDHTH